jgi:hypothetical protein
MAKQYRTSSLSDPWTPDFASLTERDARGYVDAELRYAWSVAGRRKWWIAPNGWLDGKTPEEALAAGEYERIWRAATACRESGGS